MNNEETEIEDETKVQEIDIDSIHTVYAIKDGMFEIVDKSELSKKNYFYRVHSKVGGVVVIDYDKTNVVPIVKDILNRQNTFIEIKYLRWVIGLEILLIMFLIVVAILIPFGRSTFDTEKKEIISEIQKYGKEAMKKQEIVPPAPIYTPIIEPSPSTTQSPGYNPILPPNTTPNNRKNIPNNAN